ncbi:MAG: hypothetical protein ABI903_15215 [Actinomycetota bacterium]
MSSPASLGVRKHARNRALVLVSAITLGAGAAGVVGTAVIASTLPGSTSATSSASSGSTTSVTSGSQLQAGTAPSAANTPPVATSGAS